MFNRLRSAIAARLLKGTRERHTVRGFTVVVENTRPDIETADVLARLDDALALIERYQPWRLAHLRRDLAMIWIVRYPCRGAYYPIERACVTELTFLARRDISAATVAASGGSASAASTRWAAPSCRAPLTTAAAQAAAAAVAVSRSQGPGTSAFSATT